jgi:prophage regulatory protein
LDTQFQQAAPTNSERLIRESECLRRTGLSRTQRWRLERAGTFPARVPLSERTFGWVESEVQEWITNRIRKRPQRLAA